MNTNHGPTMVGPFSFPQGTALLANKEVGSWLRSFGKGVEWRRKKVLRKKL